MGLGGSRSKCGAAVGPGAMRCQQLSRRLADLQKARSILLCSVRQPVQDFDIDSNNAES